MRIQNRPLFLSMTIVYHQNNFVYCEGFEYEFENNRGIMGWFERIIGEKFGIKE